MKLGIFMYSLLGGGAERQFLYLLSYCNERNIDVCLILMNSTKKYDLPKGIKIHYLEQSHSSESGMLKAVKIPYLAQRYAKLVKKLQLTHSISLLTRPNYINILAKTFTNRSYKLIINELAYPSLEYGYGNFQSKFNKFMIRLLFKKADLIICNSKGNQNDLIHNFNVAPNQTKVIYNPIDLNKIEAVQPIKSFFDVNFFNLITIGRLDEGKNHELIIRSISKINNPQIRLYIFGEGILYDYLNELINNLNLQKQVFLMGFDPNPFKYLKSADLFVFGSNHEGFPNVLLEAMACGLPILTTNCPSGPSEIMKLSNAQENLMITNYGILVPTKDLQLMSEGILYFIKNKDYMISCKSHVIERIKDFKKDTILKKYVETVKSI